MTTPAQAILDRYVPKREPTKLPTPASKPAALIAEIHHHLANAHYHGTDPICEAEIRAARDRLRDLEALVADPGPTYLTAVEAAERLRVCDSWVKERCRSGALRAIKAGNGWRIDAADLDRFANRSR